MAGRAVDGMSDHQTTAINDTSDEAAIDTPVYVPSLSPHFFDSAESAAERAWDDGLDPTTVEAHPCTVGKCPVPCLVELVEEAWWEQYDDPDAYDVGIPEPLRSELDALNGRLEAAAPTVWTPRLRERVVLPAVDCPECGRASNEPWPEHVADCDFCGRPSDSGLDITPPEREQNGSSSEATS